MESYQVFQYVKIKELDNLINSSAVELKYQNLKRQQDIANHIKDTKNKLGTQIARAIITNINKPGVVKEYFNLLKYNIEEDSARLLDDMGISKVGDEYSIDNTKLKIIKRFEKYN